MDLLFMSVFGEKIESMKVCHGADVVGADGAEKDVADAARWNSTSSWKLICCMPACVC